MHHWITNCEELIAKFGVTFPFKQINQKTVGMKDRSVRPSRSSTAVFARLSLLPNSLLENKHWTFITYNIVAMGQGRITLVEKFDYDFERNKNYWTFRRERISWRPAEVIRRWGHHSTEAAPCSDRFVGAGTPVASHTVSQRKSWKSSSWKSYPRRPGSDRRANRCTRYLCSRIGHCEAATVADASQFHDSRCTRIHRIRRS